MLVVDDAWSPAVVRAGAVLRSARWWSPGWPRRCSARGWNARRAATVAARAAFATALVSSLSAARTVKLAGATRPVLAHLARLDARPQRPAAPGDLDAGAGPGRPRRCVSGLLPIGAWALYLAGGLSAGATLVAVSTLGAARWFAWTTASLVSQLPVGAGVDPAHGRRWPASATTRRRCRAWTSRPAPRPAPPAAPRHPLRRLELAGFSAVHEDGTVGVRDVDLTVERGQLVLVVGPVGSGKSSLLRALAGIVHHTGALRWNGEPVTEPELFLRPNQVGYVGQLPRVLSGTVADNIRLGHEVDAAERGVAPPSSTTTWPPPAAGSALLIGHKGTRLSGGQLQRLALARALAPRTELLIADDVSSALDVTTELELWRALREHGVTVVGSTSKRAALAQADQVVVLIGGAAAAQGTVARPGGPLGPPGRLTGGRAAAHRQPPGRPGSGGAGVLGRARRVRRRAWRRPGAASTGRAAAPARAAPGRPRRRRRSARPARAR